MLATAAHQQAAGAAAHGEHLVLGGIAAGDEVARHVDEVGEGVLLVQQRPSSYHARPISWPPRTCAIAIHEAAIEQAQARR
jgi:hypothetical protein